mmetsp:Transcript_22277/g.69854  ORF Transcript_22277/g.69854 Transcript_22277/m.69854 type:complete len:148 (+) Transcript_22277:120-563(+)
MGAERTFPLCLCALFSSLVLVPAAAAVTVRLSPALAQLLCRKACHEVVEAQWLILAAAPLLIHPLQLSLRQASPQKGVPLFATLIKLVLCQSRLSSVARTASQSARTHKSACSVRRRTTASSSSGGGGGAGHSVVNTRVELCHARCN